MSERIKPMKQGDTCALHSKWDAEATIVCDGWDDDNDRPLYSVEITGLVSWAELEALAHLLHPEGITAIDHACEVRGAMDGWKIDGEVSDE